MQKPLVAANEKPRRGRRRPRAAAQRGFSLAPPHLQFAGASLLTRRPAVGSGPSRLGALACSACAFRSDPVRRPRTGGPAQHSDFDSQVSPPVTLHVGGGATHTPFSQVSPDAGPRDWQEKVESVGELGGPPVVPEPGAAEPAARGRAGRPTRPRPPSRRGASTPTCRSWPPASRRSGDRGAAGRAHRAGRRADRAGPARAARRRPGAGDDGARRHDRRRRADRPGALPGYAEDRLVYAYATTPTDNRVLRLAPGEDPNRSSRHPARRPRQRRRAGDRREERAAGGHRLGRASPGRRIAGRASCCGSTRWAARPRTTRTRRRRSSAPACALRPGCARRAATIWVTDPPGARDVLYRAAPGRAGRPGLDAGRTGRGWAGAWRSTGCCWWRRPTARSVFVLRPGPKRRVHR